MKIFVEQTAYGQASETNNNDSNKKAKIPH